MRPSFIYIFFAFAGCFSMCGAVFDLDFFMEARKAKYLVYLIGRSKTRYFYFILGFMASVVALLGLLGLIKD